MLALAAPRAGAVEHPACTDKGLDNSLCDLMAMVINFGDRLCWRVVDVRPLGDPPGPVDSVYRVTCEHTSYDPSHVVHTVECTDGVGCFLRQ